MLRLGKFSFVFMTLLCGQTLAQTSGMVRIGVMNDMAGVYSDDQGPGSVLAAQLAVEDHGSQAAGRKGEVVSADHQNKTDLGAAIARRWVENEGVNMIADLPNSAIALAVNEVVRDHNSVMLASGAGTALLTGGKCSPNTIHWTYDTWAYGYCNPGSCGRERDRHFANPEHARGIQEAFQRHLEPNGSPRLF